MAFPNNPNPGDTYTDEYGTVWVYAGPINGWYRRTVIPVNDTTYIGSDGAPGGIGNNTEVVFNDNGSLASDSGLTYNKTTDALSGGAFVPTGSTVPSNGVYRPSANNVAISTNGTGRLFVDSSGRVGLGTSSPSAPLQVSNSSTLGGLIRVGGNDSGGIGLDIDYQNSGTTATVIKQLYRAYNANALIDIDTGIFTVSTGSSGDERLRITSDGKLGLGTSSPGRELHISGAGTNGTQLQIQGTSASAGIKFIPNSGDNWEIQADIGNNFFIYNRTDEATRFVINGSGNVGIGTTSPSTALDVAGAISLGTVAIPSAGTARIFSRNTDNNLYIQAGSGSAINLLDASQNTMAVFEPTSVRFQISNSERARIDSSGRLLVGTSTTSAAPLTVNGTVEANGSLYRAVFGNGYLDSDSGGVAGGNAAEVQIQSASSSRPAILSLGGGQGSGEALGAISFFNSNNTDGKRLRASIVCGQEGATANEQGGLLTFSTTADGASSPTERVRIDSSGNLLVGGTYTTWLSDYAGAIYGKGGSPRLILGRDDASDATARTAAIFTNSSDNAVGSITVTSTATAYVTSSDYRLKENVVPLTGAADRVKQLNPSQFNFIADPDTTVDGFIAHEAQAVVPECVTGTKDEVDDEGNPVYQGIDQSKLVPLLTAALQEAIGRIETLEAEVAALKAS